MWVPRRVIVSLRWVFLVGCVALVGLLPGGGRAARADDLGRARELFARGQTAFESGHFLDAAKLFDEAYALTQSQPLRQRRALLWNIAQSYKRQYEVDHDLVNLRRARIVYRNFAELAETAPERDDGRREEAAVDAEIRLAEAAARGTAATGGATGAGGAGAGATTTAGVGGASASGGAGTQTAPSTLRTDLALQPMAPSRAAATPAYRRWWLWTAVGAVVVAGAAGALAAALVPNDAPAPLGRDATYAPTFH